jgi:hypothetical protein
VYSCFSNPVSFPEICLLPIHYTSVTTNQYLSPIILYLNRVSAVYRINVPHPGAQSLKIVDYYKDKFQTEWSLCLYNCVNVWLWFVLTRSDIYTFQYRPIVRYNSCVEDRDAK